MSNVAIIGGGPAGLTCAITAKRNNPKLDVTIFEKKDIASTLLPTGGGRCNMTFLDDDIKSFVKNYPRGEKFLYSIFNQFFVQDTIDFFKSIGIETYVQKDFRVFPKSNKSLDVIFALKNEIKRLGITILNEEVNSIKLANNNFYVNDKLFNKVVLAVGGRRTKLLNNFANMGHTIIEQKPALCGLKLAEKELCNLAGVSLKDVDATVIYHTKKKKLSGDLLFTHKGISGPLAYKISSIYSAENYLETEPIVVYLNFIRNDNFNLQYELEKNSKKEIQTFLGFFMPKSLANLALEQINISPKKLCHQIVKDERKNLENIIKEFKLTVISPVKEEEIVASGGICLNEINSKTMMSKIVNNLFFCGEVIDVDGFCGGFNLQNCWSTGYVAGKNL